MADGRNRSVRVYRQMMTVGLLFNGDDVLLVEKEKPSWQKGLLNGVGGKAEFGETPIECLKREFKEETGVDTSSNWAWRAVAVEAGPDYELHAFASFVDRDVFTSFDPKQVPSKNDAGEKLHWISVVELPVYPVIGNLRWIVPMAQDWRRQNYPVVFATEEHIRRRATWR